MTTLSVAPRVLVVTTFAGASFLATMPASAADTWTTTTVAVPSRTVVQYGESIDIDVDLDSSSGDAPTRGTTTLLARAAGASAWKPVATADAPGDDFTGVTPRGNTLYKVVYSGSTASSSSGDSYASSESSELRVSVRRKITYPSSGFVLKGRVTPRYGRKPVAIRVSRSQRSGFTHYRTIRTDARGRYKITLPRRDGVWYWRVKVRGGARFIPSSYVWETRIFH